MPSVSTDVFSVYRGTEEKITGAEINNGAVYFATDTNKIMFDAGNARHVIQSGSDVTFYVGNDAPAEDPNDLDTWLLDPANIQAERIKTDDVILNSDNKFYRVIEEDRNGKIACVMIAGGGGGGGSTGSSRRLQIKATSQAKNFPDVNAYGYDITGELMVSSNMDGEGDWASIEVVINNITKGTSTSLAPMSVEIGKPFTVTIPKAQIEEGTISLKIIPSVDYDSEAKANVFTKTLQVLKIALQPDTTTWNPLALFGPSAGALDFSYSITGKSVSSTDVISIAYSIDNTEVAVVQEKTLSGTAHLSEYPAVQDLAHGPHTLEIVASLTLNGTVIELTRLSYEFMWIVAGNHTPIIISTYDKSEEKNYSLIEIPYMVYDPDNAEIEVHFIINGEEVTSGALKQTYTKDGYYTWEVSEYVPDSINTFTIKTGTVERSFAVNIIRDDSRNLDAITDNLYLYLSAAGRSNNENSYNRSRWLNKAANSSYDGTVTFDGFNWYNNGWVKDEEGHTALRLSNGANISIPLDIMAAQTNNLTFELEFKIKNTTNYQKLVYVEMVEDLDTSGNVQYDKDGEVKMKAVKRISTDVGLVGTYFSNNIGLAIGAQETYFKGSSQVVNVQYPDEERVKVSVVLNSKESRMYIYINGVTTGVVAYKNNENFASNAKALVFNSDFCDIDIYNIRVYQTALSYNNIVQNWIGDAPDLASRLERYNNNAIYKIVNGKVVLDYDLTLASKLIPVMVITTYDKYDENGIKDEAAGNNSLPFKKGDKKGVAVRYYDPEDETDPERIADPTQRKSFRGINMSLDVQGTSSQGYPRRNYKLKLKKYDDKDKKHKFHLEYWNGKESWNTDENPSAAIEQWDLDTAFKKYPLGTHKIGETSFCLKADYMESSSTHNTCIADYVGFLCRSDAKYSHPLNRIKDPSTGKYIADPEKGIIRTTIYGFPILVFHENAVTGKKEFVGKYNFNLDKGATSSFGFTNEAAQPFIDKVLKFAKMEEDADFLEPVYEDDGVTPVYDDAPTYKTVSECWELKNNQSGGRATFEMDPDDFYNLDASKKYEWISDFEARYHVSDFDQKDVYEKYASNLPKANAILKSYTGNFFELYKWIYSTNPEGATNNLLSEPVIYTTLDHSYDPTHVYYKSASSAQPLTFEAKNTARKPENGTVNSDVFVAKAKEVFGDNVTGGYTFSLIDGSWILNEQEVSLEDWGVTLTAATATSIDIQVVTNYYETGTANEWVATLFEKFDNDTDRYRLAKFQSEFELHFNKAYTSMYAVLTEFLIMYDSRAKNMMLATWGPETKGGNYIWYPIFYDMDTALGINNSGVVYWDYDVNPTPDKNETYTNDAGETVSAVPIYSGATSVLWNNYHKVFEDDIKACYQQLRKSGLNYAQLVAHFDTNGSDKWSEIMKNLDAYYKYIAPISEGYTNTEGKVVYDAEGTFLYCLQGDRKLTRDLLFRNRLNYMDSRWQAGDYETSGVLSGNIQFRYNLNHSTETSDSASPQTPTYFDATAAFEIRPYLTQYLMVFYDGAVTEPVKYDVQKNTGLMHIDPISSIAAKQNGYSVATQQLAYINGPAYLAELGDLSRNYLNDFFSNSAKRLSRIVVGSERKGYKNNLLKDENFKLNSSAEVSTGVINTNAKTLLRYLDISNLTGLTSTIDVGGCTKLETVKALGTNLKDIVIPSGNVIRKMYLPNTVTRLALIQPRYLNTVLTDYATQVEWKDEYAENDIRPAGLYVQGFTDKLDSEVLSTDTTVINAFSIENTLLKYNTYKMAKRLIDIKRAMKQNEALDVNVYSPRLSITMLDVDWTPYVRVEEATPYDNSATYYTRNGDMTYSKMLGKPVSDAAWDDMLINEGVYTKSAEEDPITDLSLVRTLLDDYNQATSISRQQFIDTVTVAASVARSRPRLTGNLHVNNTEDAPLDEYQLFSEYSAAYPDLTITANYVTPCVRATFIEYNKDRKETLYVQKAQADAGTLIDYKGITPSRTHYVFKGWKETTGELQENNGIVTDLTGVISPDDLKNVALSENKTYIAIFELKAYDISFYDGNGNLVDGKPVQIKSGSVVVAPTTIPSKDESDLDTYEHYRFLGYGNNDNSTRVLDLSKITVLKDGAYYAKFVKENVYAHPLDESYLEQTSFQNDTVTVKIKSGMNLSGKICIPKYYNGRKITSIDGGDNGLARNSNITAIFFEGANDNTAVITDFSSNMCQNMGNLQHIDIPNSVTRVGNSAFSACSNLVITNLNKIQNIENDAFARVGAIFGQYGARTLHINGCIKTIGSGAFCYGGWQTIEIGSSADRTSITANDIGSRAFGLIRGVGQDENYLRALNIYTTGTITGADELSGKVVTTGEQQINISIL